MADDLRSFTLKMDEFAHRVGLSPGLVVKRVALDLFSRIVRKTPVDTGRARASWNISAGAPDLSIPEGQTFSAKNPTQALSNVNVESGQTIYITSNLSYIVPLEEGHSQQAPAGMVAVSIEEIKLSMAALVSAGVKDAGL